LITPEASFGFIGLVSQQEREDQYSSFAVRVCSPGARYRFILSATLLTNHAHAILR
jgi:hypothetical protein